MREKATDQPRAERLKDRDDLRVRAIELRLQGLSAAQIAERLGVRRSSTLNGWSVGTPVPGWTRRPRAKDDLRTKAREMRMRGLTYGEIAEQLKVSKSSISLWTRDLPRPTTAAQDYDARQAGARRYFDLRRRRVLIERQNEKLAWAIDIGSLTERELIIAGAVAYWAEGSKSKPWRSQEVVAFVNSDAAMIRLFMSYLAVLGVEKGRLRFQVQIHETADVTAAEHCWAEVLSVPVDRLQPSTLKRHRVATNRKNVGPGYHGCLCVRVLQGAALYRRIEGTWWAAPRAVVEPPGAGMEGIGIPRVLDPVSHLHPRLARFRRILKGRV